MTKLGLVRNALPPLAPSSPPPLGVSVPRSDVSPLSSPSFCTVRACESYQSELRTSVFRARAEFEIPHPRCAKNVPASFHDMSTKSSERRQELAEEQATQLYDAGVGKRMGTSE